MNIIPGNDDLSSHGVGSSLPGNEKKRQPFESRIGQVADPVFEGISELRNSDAAFNRDNNDQDDFDDDLDLDLDALLEEASEIHSEQDQIQNDIQPEHPIAHGNKDEILKNDALEAKKFLKQTFRILSP